MTENSAVLAYLKTGGSLTCRKSINMGLSDNLRSRISNLIDQGVEIQKASITVKKANGEQATVRKYWL